MTGDLPPGARMNFLRKLITPRAAGSPRNLWTFAPMILGRMAESDRYDRMQSVD